MGRVRPFQYLRDIKFGRPRGFEIPKPTPPQFERGPETVASSTPSRLALAKENDSAHFKIGLKQIWMPNFAVTFIRTPELHPRFAKFRVPLDIGKLDFRDFLWHGYQTRALNIRSWVYQRPVERQKDGIKPRAEWHRKRSIKFMIVEMDEPFIWPEMKDTSQNDKSLYNMLRDKAIKDQTAQKREDWTKGTPFLDEQRQRLKKEADRLLAGEIKWRPTHTTYTRPTHA